MSPTAAIRHARTMIGPLYRCTPDGWRYKVWSEPHRAWWLPPFGTGYDYARRLRRAAIVEAAVRAMLLDDGVPDDDTDICVDPYESCEYSRIIDWVRAEYDLAKGKG